MSCTIYTDILYYILVQWLLIVSYVRLEKLIMSGKVRYLAITTQTLNKTVCSVHVQLWKLGNGVLDRYKEPHTNFGSGCDRSNHTDNTYK